ncbi:LytTR family DNA-binding domain-containing protein [Flavobacterium sp. PL002]|uniref:LytR/AlgR family response regulator transcription factor n=1 Tax=Flavobacterium sp. PL002 TaxID=1897058 RepID=UPI001787819D|nr:LytTR family DNA-binding domain-containing protein [Flavobacterium sp. PL002]MBE0390681.1 Transcriptional regulatory protein YehT [Flavobacterium sp. PL002]
MSYSYIIIDDDQQNVLETQAVADGFSEFVFVASANNYKMGLNLILEHKPDFVFLEIDPKNIKSKLSLLLINELHRYLKKVPEIIVTTRKKKLAFEAIKYQVTDYLLKPLVKSDLVKLILKLNKSREQELGMSLNDQLTPQAILLQDKITPTQQALILCIKSYGDYRYIDTKDITYLKADNNSTDIHLNTGEMITAFKTLKHFESALYYPFVRIHNSYIVNSSYISRIHTGNAICHIKNAATKLPFSKTYKSNIDLIISKISSNNYLEI